MMYHLKNASGGHGRGRATDARAWVLEDASASQLCETPPGFDRLHREPQAFPRCICCRRRRENGRRAGARPEAGAAPPRPRRRRKSRPAPPERPAPPAPPHALGALLRGLGVFCALARPPTRDDAAALPTRPEDWERPREHASAWNASVRLRFPRDEAVFRGGTPLVFAAGLSRTGTSTIQAALMELNLTVDHSLETMAHDLDFWYYYLSGQVERPDADG
ncbi:hypothetical protein JL722_15186 [Aureococcus anophagefferens]|nr:hypothetical protein JL722_15186 [Aureococcus anophagefferens]